MGILVEVPSGKKKPRSEKDSEPGIRNPKKREAISKARDAK
jgi:hypothetical protein